MEFPLLLALALLLALSLALALVRPGIVRAAGSMEATDRNPAGAQASVTVVATVAHNRHGPTGSQRRG